MSSVGRTPAQLDERLQAGEGIGNPALVLFAGAAAMMVG
jgi:hypothetical protein